MTMHALLRQSLTLCAKIESLAADFAWDAVLSHCKERDACVKQYFKLRPLPDSDETISQIIAKINQSDQKTSALIAIKKKHLVGQGLSLKNNAEAIQQYHFAQIG